MNFRKLILLGVMLTIWFGGIFEPKRANADEQFLPLLVYRTGPYAPSGIPLANGFVDYYKLINKRDGGVNGVKLTWEECETKYNTKLGVECYEKMKNKGPTGASVVNPYSTGITYQLIPKASVDKVPIFSMGYGRTSAADGRVFKWVFNFPTTYWSQASAIIKYIGTQVGGMGNLKGKKIAHVFHNSAYGKEANPTLEILSKKYGFSLLKLAVDHPGQEQKATWLQIRRKKPDWVFMSGWGVMNSTAIKEAAAVGFPMNRFIGNWWSGSEADVIPGGTKSIGYRSAAMHGAGTNYKVFQDIVIHNYGGDKNKAKEAKMGEVLYNRGVLNAAFVVEAIRTAQAKYGKKSLTGEQVRWGFENLNFGSSTMNRLGLAGFTNAVKVSCKDHENGGPIFIQKWDGSKWNMVSNPITPDMSVVRPLMEADAAKFAKENKIKPRDC